MKRRCGLSHRGSCHFNYLNAIALFASYDKLFNRASILFFLSLVKTNVKFGIFQKIFLYRTIHNLFRIAYTSRKKKYVEKIFGRRIIRIVNLREVKSRGSRKYLNKRDQDVVFEVCILLSVQITFVPLWPWIVWHTPYVYSLNSFFIYTDI